ncbi:hypothetical protein HLH33_18705 [Gluconacetobacter diazotrophicus]|uniref:Uncharacterized protein n=1 Tax=Gluconacetobacter diazotrophicus TaxID=33996 RepID=A0A7W4I8S1_GLUDI|nr:hypothetical protein [Gluconacetobacter diazotrophicus]MBB2158296.1 hypothetical protein [Gluconacetobacter diazotrophicus]
MTDNQMTAPVSLSDAEISALTHLEVGVRVRADDLPPRTVTDSFGEILPGRRVWHRLSRLGLVQIPDEDPIDIDGEPFFFTPLVEITDAGRAALSASNRGSNHD